MLTGMEIARAISTNERCFLGDEAWLNVLYDKAETPGTPDELADTPETLIRAHEDHLQTAMKLPQLVDRAALFRSQLSDCHSTATPEKYLNIMSELGQFSVECKTWRWNHLSNGFPTPESPSTILKDHRYDEPTLAYLDTSVLFCLITSQCLVYTLYHHEAQENSRQKVFEVAGDECSSLPSSTQLIIEIETFALALKQAILRSPRSLAAPGRLIQVAMQNLDDIFRELPPSTRSIVEEARSAWQIPKAQACHTGTHCRSQSPGQVSVSSQS